MNGFITRGKATDKSAVRSPWDVPAEARSQHYDIVDSKSYGYINNGAGLLAPP